MLDSALACCGCARQFPITDGIPVLTTTATIPTKLEQSDYDAAYGVTDQMIDATGKQWSEVIGEWGVRPESVLEIGAGTGVLTLGLLREEVARRITATDVSHKFLRLLADRATAYPTRVSPIVCDANEPHFRAEAFDLVVGRLILHHLLDYRVTLQHCHRILKPGGAAIFFEPVIEGKVIITLLMALILRCEEATGSGLLSAEDREKVRAMIQHHTKAKWYPQDRESLARIEDKYIFEIEELRATGRSAGFAEVDVANSGTVVPTYWPYLVQTLSLLGIGSEKIQGYKWMGEEFANTYALMRADALVTPVAYFKFQKAC